MVNTWLVFLTILCFHKVINCINDDETTEDETADEDFFGKTGALLSCGKGWFTFGDMCYRLGGKKKVGKMTWEKASERCHDEYNANLVSIHSQELQDFLTTFFSLSVRESVWIGLHDRVNESIYNWVDESPVDYTNWEPFEPSGVDNEKEDCAEMVSRSLRTEGKPGHWNDVSCDDERQFICQKEKGKQRKMYPDPRYCSPDVGGGWSFEKSCFHIVSEEKTWFEAEEYCVRNFTGHLVTIPDYAATLFLNYILRDQEEDRWIGIRLKEEPQQRWSSGWYVAYENWEKSEEGFTEGTCAVRDAEGQWSTIGCNKMLPFVCEYSTVRPPALRPAVEGSFCPPVPKWRDLGGDLCYYIETKFLSSWFQASFNCMRAGGTLVIIHSQEEVNMLHNFVRYTTYSVHIGLHRSQKLDEEFCWADGSALGFNRWESNEPNTESEQCVEMKTENMKWNDVDCSQSKGYICSIPKIIPNGTSGQFPNQASCLSGFSVNALLGVMFCVIFVALLMGVVIYYFRLCERGYERVKKTSGTRLQSPSALDKKPRYRSEIVVTDDDPNYENVA